MSAWVELFGTPETNVRYAKRYADCIKNDLVKLGNIMIQMKYTTRQETLKNLRDTWSPRRCCVVGMFIEKWNHNHQDFFLEQLWLKEVDAVQSLHRIFSLRIFTAHCSRAAAGGNSRHMPSQLWKVYSLFVLWSHFQANMFSIVFGIIFGNKNVIRSWKEFWTFIVDIHPCLNESDSFWSSLDHFSALLLHLVFCSVQKYCTLSTKLSIMLAKCTIVLKSGIFTPQNKWPSLAAPPPCAWGEH